MAKRQDLLAIVPPLGPEAVNCTGSHVIGISGGKDSVALALALKSTYPEVTWTFAITPTGDELPEMHAHWSRLETLLDQKLLRLSCPTLKETIRKNKALPNFRMRFCTRDIKIEPFMSFMESLPADSVLYVGLRADEEDRTGIQVTEEDTYRVTFPFQWWEWTLETVLGYLELKDIYIPERTDCARCFYQRLDEWHSLYVKYPKIYWDACLDEMIMGHTYRSDKRDTWPASLFNLAQEFNKGRIPQKRKAKEKIAQCPWCAK